MRTFGFIALGREPVYNQQRANNAMMRVDVNTSNGQMPIKNDVVLFGNTPAFVTKVIAGSMFNVYHVAPRLTEQEHDKRLSQLVDAMRVCQEGKERGIIKGNNFLEATSTPSLKAPQ